MKLVLGIFLVLITGFSNAQKSTSVWCFGDSAGIDFSSGAPVLFPSSMDGRGSCCSIADTVGNLNFYCNHNSNGDTKIYTKLHTPMANSNTMVGDGFYQGLLIIPMPGNSSLYYVYTNYSPGGLYYHIIDMSMNGGLGQVVQKNVVVTTKKIGDCLSAIKHGNGRDWWIITKRSSPNPVTYFNRFILYLLTPNGITDSLYQDFNDATDADNQKIIFKNPDSAKFMLMNAAGYLMEFEINRCNGNLDTVRTIFEEQTGNYNRLFWEGAYSPNGNLFYVSRTSYGGFFGSYNYLLQYDLTSFNIPASCDTLDSTLYPITDCGAVRLAPDGKIYYSQAYPWGYPYPDSMYNYINMNLGVINYPDSLGAACNFQPFSFYLGGKRTYYGLPNNPNYSLGKLVGSTCDTIQYTGLTPPDASGLPVGEGSLTATYISSWQKLFVNAQNIKGKNCVLKIFDVNGRVVKSINKISQPPYFTQDIDVSSLASGLYLISLTTEKEMLSTKFVKD